MSTAAIVGGSLAGSLATGIIGSKAAGHAADTQAAAANNAADLERQSATDALNFNKLQYGNSLSLLSPFYNTGVSANSRLAYLMGLNPAQGLPPGVVNPNAPAARPQTQIGAGVGTANRLNFLSTLPGGSNPLANDPALGPLGPGMQNSGPRFSPMQDGTAAGIDPGMITASPFAGQVGQTSLPGGGFGVNPQNPDPNDPSQTSFPNPDIGRFNPGGNGGLGINPADPNTVTASTNQGGTGQVPRIDGGGLPGQNPPDSGPGSFGSLAQGWNQTFQSPTNLTDDPGYNFRLQEGMKALQNSAAAKGGLLTGGTAKALNDYAGGSASQEYQNTYNRALQNYDTNYNTFTNDQTNLFNRLSTLAGQGQVSANNLSASGLTAANNAANIGLTSAAQIGQQYNNAGAANASGYVGGANAITGGINSATNSLSLLALLNRGRGTPSYPTPDYGSLSFG
jgi:hypothetical protein